MAVIVASSSTLSAAKPSTTLDMHCSRSASVKLARSISWSPTRISPSLPLPDAWAVSPRSSPA